MIEEEEVQDDNGFLQNEDLKQFREELKQEELPLPLTRQGDD